MPAEETIDQLLNDAKEAGGRVWRLVRLTPEGEDERGADFIVTPNDEQLTDRDFASRILIPALTAVRGR